MATRAEQFRAEQQFNSRKAKPKPKAHAAPRSVDAATAGVSGEGHAQQNFSHRSNNKGGPALEVSASGKPSRKSTRSSASHVKQASNLTSRQTRRVTSPQARATRAVARA